MTLSVQTIRKFKPGAEGKRREIYDHEIRGFGVRVTDKGAKSYILVYSYQGRRRRYTIAPIGEITLEDAREKARELRGQIRQGRDPCSEAKAARAITKAETGKTFGEMIKLYDRRRLSTLRRGREMMLSIEKHLLPRWRDLSLSTITRGHIREIVGELVDQGHRAAARRILEICKAFFSWAVEHDGITESPAADLRAKTLVGEKPKRDRILTDQEWRALFAVLPEIGYPFAPGIELLARTGLRLNEVFAATESELDFDKRQWTIPAERMKNEQKFVVPLTAEMIEIFKSLPDTGGPCLFSTNNGRSPVTGFSQLKTRLDGLMARELGTVTPWTFHDIRRSARTQWSSLPIPGADQVRELMMAHAQPTLHATYDLYAYLGERFEGYRLWQQRLQSILENRTASVTQLRSA
jgi:integrase